MIITDVQASFVCEGRKYKEEVRHGKAEKYETSRVMVAGLK
jgi:hypothetical protein